MHPIMQAMADEAQADLDEALPALEAALDSLKALNKVRKCSTFDLRNSETACLRSSLGSFQALNMECTLLLHLKYTSSVSTMQPLLRVLGSVQALVMDCTLPPPQIPQNDIVEIKSFPKPPPLVQMTLEAVCILKQEKPDWDTVRLPG